MPVYHCELCQFTTPLKANYTAHTSSQKHLRFVQIRDLRQPVDNPPTNLAEKVAEFTCKHCDQKFAFKQSMYRHIKNSCKKKDQELAKDQEHKEPVRLLKITIEQLNNEIKNQNERLEAHQNQINQLLNMSFHTNNHANVGQLQKDILEQINCVFNR